MDQLEKKLVQALHLSRYEIKIYLAGLNFEHATLTDLAKAAGIPRTAVYPPLKKLLDRGLISSIKIGKRIHYRSLDSKHLSAILERDKKSLEEVVGELTQRIDIPVVETSVQYFPGIHGIETASEIFLSETKIKLWKTFENPEPMLKKIGGHGFDAYVAKRVKRGIRSHIITPGNPKMEWVQERIKNAEKDLNDVILISPESYPIKSSLAIAGNIILMLDANIIPFAILIKNADLARTLESLHDIAWDRYKK